MGDGDADLHRGHDRRGAQHDLENQPPEQVERVYIREVPGSDLDPGRFERAFAGLPTALWRTFSDPSELSLP